jgi:hypothetical protein
MFRRAWEVGRTESAPYTMNVAVELHILHVLCLRPWRDFDPRLGVLVSTTRKSRLSLEPIDILRV